VIYQRKSWSEVCEMKNSLRRVYVDANVLIAYVADEANRSGVVQQVLHDARENRIELHTSVISIAEVAYVTTGPANDDSVGGEDLIDQFWVPASPINLVDVSVRVARDARSIIRDAKRRGNRGVRSADAVHLASAGVRQCDLFLTYEKESTRENWDRLIQAQVVEPFTNTPQFDLRV